jgi:hypothetical protein
VAETALERAAELVFMESMDEKVPARSRRHFGRRFNRLLRK